MEARDSENRKDSEVRQPKLESLESEWLIRGPHWESKEAGILRIPPESGKTPEETQWMQEHHNSGHALWYLSIVTHIIVSGKKVEEGTRKANIVLAHLSCLREFVRDEDTRLKVIIARLVDTLLSEFPTDDSSWRHFIHTHWFLIQAFAGHYGQHEKCFSQAIYAKVCDVVYGRQYLRYWWWELTLRKLIKSSRHFLKSQLSKFLTKDGRSAATFKAFFNNKMAAATLLLKSPRVKRDPAMVGRVVNSIDDIFHHFCPKASHLENLFEEFIAILKKCPNLTEEDSQKGLNIAEELLRAFDRKEKASMDYSAENNGGKSREGNG